jgi:hypothetical protein
VEVDHREFAEQTGFEGTRAQSYRGHQWDEEADHQKSVKQYELEEGTRGEGTLMNVKGNGTYGFILPDIGKKEVFVIPAAEGGFLPPLGSRIVYDVVTDSKTRRLRAQIVEVVNSDWHTERGEKWEEDDVDESWQGYHRSAASTTNHKASWKSERHDNNFRDGASERWCKDGAEAHWRQESVWRGGLQSDRDNREASWKGSSHSDHDYRTSWKGGLHSNLDHDGTSWKGGLHSDLDNDDVPWKGGLRSDLDHDEASCKGGLYSERPNDATWDQSVRGDDFEGETREPQKPKRSKLFALAGLKVVEGHLRGKPSVHAKAEVRPPPGYERNGEGHAATTENGAAPSVAEEKQYQ